MPSPFPGMDPYLEHPEFFPDLHDSLVIYLREALQSLLPEPSYVGARSRVWVGPARCFVEPDVILSPANGPLSAQPGEGAGLEGAVAVRLRQAVHVTDG